MEGDFTDLDYWPGPDDLPPIPFFGEVIRIQQADGRIFFDINVKKEHLDRYLSPAIWVTTVLTVIPAWTFRGVDKPTQVMTFEVNTDQLVRLSLLYYEGLE